MKPETLLGSATGRIVEIAEDRRAVTLSGAEVVIAGGDRAADHVPVATIAGMVASRPGPTWSSAALAALTEHCVGIVLRGPNHESQTLTWPVENRHWPVRIRAQLDLYPPYARHLLRQLQRAATAQRALALETMGSRRRLQALVAPPRPRRRRCTATGAKDDMAAEIARHYWGWLIGPRFRRDPAQRDANAVINCGHTVLRIEAMRASHAAGLLPGIGLGSRLGSGGLADDLMIPFRPVVELAASVFIATGNDRGDARIEAAFGRLLKAPLRGRRGPVQIRFGLTELARALAHCFETGETRLDLVLPARQDPDALFTLLDAPPEPRE